MAIIPFLNNAFFAAKVGIGTESPGAKLDVSGDILIDSGEYLSWGTVGATSIEGSTASNKLQFRTNSSDRMIINDTGVGIGTTSPAQKLQVTSSTGNAYIRYNNASYTGIDIGQHFGGNIYYWNRDATDQIWGNNSVERMRITSAGNVGIGTTSPGTKLEVVDSTNAQLEVSGYSLETSTANAANGAIFIGNNSSYRGVIDYNASSTGDLIISNTYNNATSGIRFKVATSDAGGITAMKIKGNGNVGIGTTNPTSKLHVQGSATPGTYAAYIHNASGGGNVLKLYNHDWDTGDFLLYATNGGTAASDFGFTVDGNARVNIGLATVATANAAADDLHLRSLGSNGITISSGNAQTGTIFFGDVANAAAAGFRYNHNTGDMAISAEDNVTFACDNVGIGTTSPTHKLDVAGTGNFTGLVSGITPVAAANFVTKAYVDGAGGGTGPFLPLAGGTMTGAITLIDGSTTETSINFTGDPNTGIYQPADNLMGFVSNGSRKLLVDTAGVTVQNGNLFINSDSSSSANNRIIMGAGNDLQIYHDGSNSYINEVGVGDLIIKGGNDIVFQDAVGNILVNMNQSNSVELYYGGSKKFETTNTGVSVTGLMQASTVGVTNIVTNKVVKFNGTILDDSNITDTGSLITLGSATTATGTLTVTGNGIFTAKVGIGTTSPQAFTRLDIRSDQGIANSHGIAAYGYNETSTAILGNGYHSGTGVGRNYGVRGISTGPRSTTVGSINIGGYFAASAAQTNYALITGGGNVGINNASPAFSLDVAGTGNFTGLVSGITPVAAANFVTKAYADGLTPGVGVFLPLAGGTLDSGATINMSGTLTIDGSSSVLMKVKGGARISLENANATDSFYIANTGGNLASILDLGSTLTIAENGGTSTFAGAGAFAGKLGVGVAAPHGSYDFYNQGTAYFNGAVTVDDAFTQSGNLASTFSGTVTSPTFLGDLNGTINTVTTAVTKANATNDTTVATTAFVQNLIGTIPAGLVFQGTWNAATNTPTLTSGSGTTGHFYIVSTSGSTNLDGVTDWVTGDWAVFIEQGGTDAWEKIDNSSVLDGIGTGNTISKWAGSGTSNTLTNSLLTDTGKLNYTTSSSALTTLKGTSAAGYAELDIANDSDHRIVIGSIGSTYPSADWAGSTYLYNTGTSKKMYIKSISDMQFFTGGYTVASNIRMTILGTNGDVGIGTTSPQTKLAIGSSQGSGIDFLYDATNNYKHQIKNYWNSSADSRMDFNIGRTSGVTPVTVMSVGYNNNVGIGTTSPGAKLVVKDSQDATFNKGIAFERSNTTQSGYLNMVGGAMNIVSYDNLPIKFRTGSNATNTPMTIEAGGNVGVGIISPNAKLEVQGPNITSGTPVDLKKFNAITTSLATSAYYGGFAQFWVGRYANTSNHSKTSLVISLNDGLYSSSTSNADTDVMTLLASGDVGIGTTSPKSKLQVAGGIQMADDTDTASADKVGTMRYRTGTEYVETTGTQLLLNNNFDTDTVWSKGTGWAISGGKANATASTDYLSQNPWNPTTSNYYQVTWTISNYVSGTYRFYMRGNVSADFGTSTYIGDGTFTHVMQAGTGGANGFLFDGRAALTASIDNIIVTEVTVKNASYADMCMQTGSSTYEWVNIVRNTY